ncbi:alkaline exonuclease [Human betaherpesvirus 6A]|uniref:Alkaline exonuclease n=2 Tax=root TaxID=1 RepID=A0A126LB18_HUMAN|nr:alkaline exonuclease [Human betaherpesvirus 6A]AMD82200.1 alkaline exonuclease [Homo sapiens]AVI09268.1 BGLF5 [Human betaherpesvirus 6A]
MDLDQISETLSSVAEEEPLTMFLLDKLYAIREKIKQVPFSIVRLCHVYCMLIKYNASNNNCILGRKLIEEMQQFLCGTRVDGSEDISMDLSELCKLYDYCPLLCSALCRAPCVSVNKLFKIVERETRGQSENPLWHALRKYTVTATKLYDIYTTRSFLEYKGQQFFGEAVIYGAKHERVIRHLVATFYVKREVKETLGLLLDPSSGVFGASLDACFGISFNEDGFLMVKEKALIFEIKFKYKYLRDKEDHFVSELLKNPTEKSFSDFILSHPVPVIEFRERGKIPSSREYLMTYDFQYRPQRKLRTCPTPAILAPHIKQLLCLNETQKSTVIVFDCKSDLCEQKLSVFQKAVFTVNVFVNPKHRYFFQSLLQQYVMTQFYINDHNNPEYIESTEVPSVHIVTAFFRRRTEEERSLHLVIDETEYIEEEIPLALIVTPVAPNPEFTCCVITDICNLWENNICKQTSLQVWAQSAVNQYLAACVRKPKTP